MGLTNQPGSAPRVLVIGAGGHALVCIESLTDGGHEVIGCVSSDGSGVSTLPCPVLGRDSELRALAAAHGATAAFVGIGDNAARERWVQRCDELGLPLASAVSRYAMVSPSARLADGVAVMAGAVVNAAAVVHRGVIINTRASIDHEVEVGPFSHVAVGVCVAGGVHIGCRTLLGVGAVVIPGRQIGDDAVVAAGAVVVRDVDARATVMGVPARPVAGR